MILYLEPSSSSSLFSLLFSILFFPLFLSLPLVIKAFLALRDCWKTEESEIQNENQIKIVCACVHFNFHLCTETQTDRCVLTHQQADDHNPENLSLLLILELIWFLTQQQLLYYIRTYSYKHTSKVIVSIYLEPKLITRNLFTTCTAALRDRRRIN